MTTKPLHLFNILSDELGAQKILLKQLLIKILKKLLI